jgi:hypothetical protein
MEKLDVIRSATTGRTTDGKSHADTLDENPWPDRYAEKNAYQTRITRHA